MHERVCQLLRRMYLSKGTGVLLSELGGNERSLFLRSGLVVGARSSFESERLGEVMVRHGHITQQHFEDASHFIKGGRRMGDILAELGITDREESTDISGFRSWTLPAPCSWSPPND